MSFSDNLENSLKNLESGGEHDRGESKQTQVSRQSQRAHVLATAPNAEILRNGKFTAGLLTHATRIGHGLRTKVNIAWLGTTLRLQAREHRLELRPAPDGVTAYFFVNEQQTGEETLDMNGNPELLAKRWLGTVGPRPAPEPDLDLE